jgi:hypothetical protein
MQQVLLSPTEQYIHLGSEYAVGRYNTNNFIAQNADVHFNITEPIGDSRAQNYVMCIGVHNASIPHTWTNMIHGYSFTYQRLGSNKLTLFVPKTHYTGESLAAAMQLAIENKGNNDISIIYDDNTGKMVISDIVQFQLAYTSNNIYYEIGFRDIWKTENTVTSINYDITTSRWTLESTGIVDLSGFHSIYVALVNVASNNIASYNGLQRGSIISRIPITSSFQSLEVFEPNNITYVTLYDRTIQDLHLQLLDDDGNLLQMNGVDWSMTLHVKFMEMYNTMR